MTLTAALRSLYDEPVHELSASMGWEASLEMPLGENLDMRLRVTNIPILATHGTGIMNSRVL